MTSEYSEVYSRFMLRITDYDIAGLEESLAYDMMSGWMRSVLSKPMVRRLFASVVLDDDVEEIEYVLSNPWDDDADKDFVEELLSVGMVVEWVSPKYHSILNTN